MNNILKTVYRKLIKRNTYNIKQLELNNEFSMEGALFRCKQRGLRINTVIDIGASNGSWSRICKKYLPNASYLLIEAQLPHKDSLERFKLDFYNTDYILAAAGNRTGKIYFDNADLFGGLASEIPFEKNCIEVPVVTIDNEIKKRGLKEPFLIKLDTHGYEIPIIEGAQETIKHSNLIIIETYNFRITPTSLRYYEMAHFMNEKGFSSIEMVDFLLRKRDHSFWQMDTFFIPSSSKEFVNNTYL